MRMKRAILQWFIFNIVVFLIFVLIWLFQVLPKYFEVQSISKELTQTVDTINKTQIAWINFGVFKSIASSWDNSNPYLNTVISEAGKDFYDSIILNKEQENFEKHIKILSQELEEYKKTNNYLDRQNSLATILPVYVPWDSWGLKDVDFINYIERLLYTFSLSKKWNIGIWNIINIQEDSSNNLENSLDSESKLDEWIYYIPLSFEIVGQKKNVFEFIHYFENVGGISYDSETIHVHTDDVLRKKIHWEDARINIYESQFADIFSLSMYEYPDSSTFSSTSQNNSLLDLISNSQWRERFEVDIELRFYVSGLPTYSMEQFINETIVLWESLTQNIKNDYAKMQQRESTLTLWSEIQALEELKNLDIFMSSFIQGLWKFKVEFLKKSDISWSYQEARLLEKQINLIDLKYQEALKNLELKQ